MVASIASSEARTSVDCNGFSRKGRPENFGGSNRREMALKKQNGTCKASSTSATSKTRWSPPKWMSSSAASIRLSAIAARASALNQPVLTRVGEDARDRCANYGAILNDQNGAAIVNLERHSAN